MGICTSILIEKIEALEKRVLELEKNQVVAESATSEEVYKVKDLMGVENGWRNMFEAIGAKRNDDEIHLPQKDLDSILDEQEKENSEKPNKQGFDRERSLELLQDIESSSTKNSNASTKAILLSCAELREMLVGE